MAVLGDPIYLFKGFQGPTQRFRVSGLGLGVSGLGSLGIKVEVFVLGESGTDTYSFLGEENTMRRRIWQLFFTHVICCIN